MTPKKFLIWKNFWSNIFFVLVLLVTWTPNPLKSAKSPWVFYGSNFSLLALPPLIYFGGGSCSCCSSCDRGTTPSLEFDKRSTWLADKSVHSPYHLCLQWTMKKRITQRCHCSPIWKSPFLRKGYFTRNKPTLFNIEKLAIKSDFITMTIRKYKRKFSQ